MFKSLTFVVGPTCIGKSDFAIKLAKKIKGEIINADSIQVYKDFKILTARPLKKNLQKIKHHLYGFQNSNRYFSTGDWLKLVIKKIDVIRKRNKVPILAGGTGLYFKALTEGLVEIPSAPTNLRTKIRNLQKKIGQEKFYKRLLKIDPLSVNKINSSDVQRSIRAYEIKMFTKKSVDEWYKEEYTKFFNAALKKFGVDSPADF